MTHYSDQTASQPTSTGVVIIGGGIAGVSAALFLAEAGIATVLCEKGSIAGEQSSRNWGWIRKQERAFEELPLMIESARLWERIAAEVDQNIGFRKGGSTYLACTQKELEKRALWLEQAREFGVDSRLLNVQQTSQLMGHVNGRFTGALHTPSDAYAEPTLAVPAMARLLKHKGGTILERTSVRSLIREAGTICGVITEQGPIRADGVILAGGIWSRTLLENEGAKFPQLAVRTSALRTTPAPPIASSTFSASGASICQRLDGGYTIGRTGAASFDLVPASLRHFGAFLPIIRQRWRNLKLSLGPSFFGPLGHQRWNADDTSPFEKVRTIDPAPDLRLLEDVMKSARQLYPQLSQSQPAQSWGGMIDVMPDQRCCVGKLPKFPGLILATGMSGQGFGIGPGVGLLASQLIRGATPIVRSDGISPLRFFNDKRVFSATDSAPTGALHSQHN